MTFARVTPKRVRDQQDWGSGNPGAGQNGYAIIYNHATGKFELGAVEAAGAVAAHVAAANPHPQYTLASSISVYGASLIAAANAGAAQTVLGLGTMATATEANYPLLTGTRPMATSQAQVFTNGIVSAKVQPIANSTNAIGLYRADGTTQDFWYDSTNGRFGLGGIPGAYQLDVYGQSQFRAAMLLAYSSNELSQMQVRNSAGGDVGSTLNVGGSGSYPNYIGSIFDATTYAGLGLVMRDNANQFMASAGQIRFMVGSGLTKSISYTSKNDSKRQFLFTADDDIWGTPPGSTFTIGSNTYTVKGAASDRITVVEPTAVEATTGTLTGVRYAPRRLTFFTDGKIAVGPITAATALFDIDASTTARNQLRLRPGTFATSPVDGDVGYVSAGRLQFRRGTTTEIVATGVQGTGGAATAGASYTAAEQSMLQKVYDAARTFGLLN